MDEDKLRCVVDGTERRRRIVIACFIVLGAWVGVPATIACVILWSWAVKELGLGGALLSEEKATSRAAERRSHGFARAGCA